MSTGGDAQNDVSDCNLQNNTPTPCPSERLKPVGTADDGKKSSTAEGGRLKFFIGR